MKTGRIFCLSVLVLFIFCAATAYAIEQEVYPRPHEHRGKDVKPKQAYEILSASPRSAFIVDVRTRFEYQDIGHPEGAYNIPWMFYTTNIGSRGYSKEKNTNFCSDLRARFNPETDTLLFICRSGDRAASAADRAVECGFRDDRVYAILGGFEGDTIKDEESPFYGKRMLGGWRLEGLPWTYDMKRDLMYKPDFDSQGTWE